MTTYYYTQNQLKTIRTNVENHCKAAQFNDVETTNVRRDVRFFGVDLFTVNGKLLNKLHYNSDSKMLNLSSKDKDMAYFIKTFNKGIISKDLNYIISDNSEFYLAFYRYNFIIILDRINNHSTNKRCFNMDGDLLTKVKDTLYSNGELNREGEEYKATFKDTVITHLERKSSISTGTTGTTGTTDKVQPKEFQKTTGISTTPKPEDPKPRNTISQSEDPKASTITTQNKDPKGSSSTQSISNTPKVPNSPIETIVPSEPNSAISTNNGSAQKVDTLKVDSEERDKDKENLLHPQFKLLHINRLYEWSGAKKFLKLLIKVLPHPYKIV